MPLLPAIQLRETTRRIFEAFQTPADEAAMVADVLVEANLAGHDSHGVIRIPQYAKAIEEGQLCPGAPWEVVRETEAMAVINGHMNFGHVTMLRALEIALQKAERTAVATVMARECHHVGRVGTYPLRAARKGFLCMAGVNAPGGRCVVPWGGIDRRMGTNPLCISAPTGGEPLVLDMTTSVVAEGKVRVQHHKKEPAPPDWLVDHEGRPTTETSKFYGQPPGALLPMGGSVGYKGFGLSVMLDILCGSLSGQGAVRLDLAPGANGVWLTVWKVAAFLPVEQYLTDVEQLANWIKSSRRKPGVEEILLPGEVEARAAERRLREGIPVPEETWSQILTVAQQRGLSVT